MGRLVPSLSLFLREQKVAESLLEGAVDDGCIVGVDGAVDARDKVASERNGGTDMK